MNDFVHRARAHVATYVAMGVAILLIDLLIGERLTFPILFVIPVALSAWYCGPNVAYSLAIALPIGRFFIAGFWWQTTPVTYSLANAAIRIAVLLLIAYFVSRTARQTRELQRQVDTLVKMCAWTRTVEYQGEWISFEEYLRRRFNVETTHGMSPAETQRQLDELAKLGRKA